MARVAVIDCGSNALHLWVARRRVTDASWEILAHEKAGIRLAGAAGLLDPGAAGRALAALAGFRRVAEGLGARRVVAVATSAVREARDGAAFARRAAAEAGVPLRIVSGEDEARLIYRGVMSARPGEARRLAVLDVGGGSTELAVGEGEALLLARSAPVGAVRLTTRYHRREPLPEREHAAMRRAARRLLGPMCAEARALGFDALVGTSGTVGALTALAGTPAALSLPALEAFETALGGQTLEERRELPGLSGSRAEIVVAGACILRVAMEALGAPALSYAPRALRDGLLAEAFAPPSLAAP